SSEAPQTTETQNGYLLVVDDNEMNRDMLSRRLKRQGHTVDVAVNGREAIDMLLRDQFDLVLLDIMMPEMNGYQVLEHMQTNAHLSNIPVIMITAVDDIDSVVRCIELGAEDYLPKPFNPVLLKARIGASLEKKRLRDRQAAYLQQLDLENQRKSDELEQARRTQLAMLPKEPPKVPFLDIAAVQHTASEVGGDYYDFFPQPHNDLIIAVGDATGHGAASGLMVSITKTSLMAIQEGDLLSFIRKINIILNRINLGKQLNMALMLLYTHANADGSVTIRVTGGGMPPIYVFHTGGEVEELLISGLPLGITDLAMYQLTEFTLQAGEAMVMASDGLSERFNAQRELLGYERLKDGLDAIQHHSR
ncbi:MAG: response regulator, partial [Okeania sp. SIO3B3]|nr:response regulator [Okeania sp. SIO3B3]